MLLWLLACSGRGALDGLWLHGDGYYDLYASEARYVEGFDIPGVRYGGWDVVHGQLVLVPDDEDRQECHTFERNGDLLFIGIAEFVGLDEDCPEGGEPTYELRRAARPEE